MKKLKLLLFTFFLGFIIISNANAKEAEFDCSDAEYQCIKCPYDFPTHNVTFYVKYTSDGRGIVTSEIKKTSNNDRLTYVFDTSDIVFSAFESKSQKKLICLNNLYAKYSGGGQATQVDVTPKKLDGYSRRSLKVKAAEDNGKIAAASDDVIKCEITAKSNNSTGSLGKATITVEKNGNISVSDVKGGYKVIIDASVNSELFKNGCPSQMFLTCGASGTDKYCNLRYGAEHIDNIRQDDGQQLTEAPDADANNSQEGNNSGFSPDDLCKDGGCDISLSGLCENPNVSSILKGVGILVFLAKVLVPAIIIGIGFINLFKLITSGKEDDAKKYAMSIVKRIGVGVIIFLLPTLINFVYNIADDIIGSGEDGGKFTNCVNCVMSPSKCNTSGNS